VIDRFYVFVAVLFVAVLSAPFARAANDPSLQYKSIETPHFRITD